MSEVAVIVAIVVLASVSLGLVRVLRGPSAFDGMLAGQLIGTGAVAIVALLAFALDAPLLLDAALVLALLAAVASVAFVRRGAARDDT
jgi:multicomponent Na+:H+ antiporter subunit F